MFGLESRDLSEMASVFSKHPEIEEVIIFGSRAMGNFKAGSDIDIALKGKKLNESTVREIEFELNEETCIPYFFDIICFEAIKNDALRKHIDDVGVEFPTLLQ